MLSVFRQQLGLGKRSRRSVIAVTWLCLLVATMPCAAAVAACCPTPTGTDHHESPSSRSEQDAHGGSHAHHDGSSAHGPQGETSTPLSHAHDKGLAGHDCSAADGECCDQAPPPLEDRSPKPVPKAGDVGLAAAQADETLNGARLQRQRQPATGPPGRYRSHPRTHLEFCSFLI